MKKSRRWLYGLLAAGLLGLGAGGGTFASFNASTTNADNTFATGTLYLSNSVNSGTACFSYNGSDNANPGCGAVFNASKAAPGSDLYTASVTIANEGTTDASGLALYSAGCTDADVAVPVTSVSLTSTSTTATIASGDTWIGTYGVSAGMEVKGTDITTGTTVVSVSGDSLTLSEAATGTGSEALTFTSTATTTGNPLCNGTLAFVEETGQTFSGAAPETYGYCWYGDETGATAGTCDTNVSTLNGVGPTSSNSLSGLATYTSDSPLNLSGLTANDTDGGATALPAGASRTFEIGLYIPDTTASQNTLMGLESDFSLTWQATQ